MYPAAARELKAELLNTLPGNLVNSCQLQIKFQQISLCQVDQLVFLPNAHGLHGGKISRRVDARFPMQPPLAQEVPAGGWESPGVR